MDWFSHFLARVLRHGTARDPALAPRKVAKRAGEEAGVEAWGLACIESRPAPRWNPKEWTFLDTGGWAQYNALIQLVCDVYPSVAEAAFQCHNHTGAKGRLLEEYKLADVGGLILAACDVLGDAK